MKISAEWFASYYKEGSGGIRALTDAQLDFYTGSAKDRGLAWAQS